MSLSTRYYILSLGSKTNLYEAFRDSPIAVENQGFPIAGPEKVPGALDTGQLRELARSVDRCFGRYYTRDPLGVVVVADQEMHSVFNAVTAHRTAVIGRIEGDHTTTSTRDLGQIVWPVVKEAMSGTLETALRDVEVSAERGLMAFGLEAVARQVNKGVRATLLVEDDFRMKGGLRSSTESPVISQDVDVRSALDDAVDAVIEKVLESGGNVVFTPSGSLSTRDRIVFMQHSVKGS